MGYFHVHSSELAPTMKRIGVGSKVTSVAVQVRKHSLYDTVMRRSVQGSVLRNISGNP